LGLGHDDLISGGQDLMFTGQIILWLWFTVLFANFAEAVAAAFRHRLGEVGEQHGEPEPEDDLAGEHQVLPARDHPRIMAQSQKSSLPKSSLLSAGLIGPALLGAVTKRTAR
jgi:uncharacterized protein involved in cysteine biosynthesis